MNAAELPLTPATRRAVYVRDGGMCVFEGCERDHYLECHHIIPWELGGPTVVENLLLLCWEHHTMVHKGGWGLEGDAGPHMTWIRPDGTVFEPRVRVTIDTS